MEWIEANIYTTSEAVEAVCAMLMGCGVKGMQIEDNSEMQSFLADNPLNWDYVDESLTENKGKDLAVFVRFYLPAGPGGLDMLKMVEQAAALLQSKDIGLQMGALSIEYKNVNDEDWIHNWKQYYKPIVIGNVVVKPQWEDYTGPKEGMTVFSIDPGHLFGTGLHQTTQLCIEALQERITSSSVVLDLGCGTGILSIISLMLGAKEAYAVDMEPDAAEVVYQNAAQNGIARERYLVKSGNILTDGPLRQDIRGRKFHLVTANIVADVIIALAPFVYEVTEPEGCFIASGIIAQRLHEVEAAVAQSGFTIAAVNMKDDWACITALRQ